MFNVYIGMTLIIHSW